MHEYIIKPMTANGHNRIVGEIVDLKATKHYKKVKEQGYLNEWSGVPQKCYECKRLFIHRDYLLQHGNIEGHNIDKPKVSKEED